MNPSDSSNLKPALKKIWKIGTKHVVVIDAEIVKRLGLSEDDTAFEQQLIDGNVVLKLVRTT